MPAPMTSALQQADIPTDKMKLAADLARGLDAYSLHWLSGYLAGAALRVEGREALVPVPTAEAPVVRTSGDETQLTILYGSRTGNAKRLAEELFAQVKAAGLPARLVRADVYRTSELKKERLLYVVMSTHSQGDTAEPPDDSRGFCEYLLGRRAPQLTHLSYAVLALGDSSYADFCGIGRQIDARLAELGAAPLWPHAEADVDIDAVAHPWIAEALRQANAQLVRCPASLTSTQASAVVTPLRPSRVTWTRERPFVAEVLANQRIVGRDSTKDVHHIELSLADSGLHYLPGDALGVWPQQAPELVERVLDAVGLDGATEVAFADDSLPLVQWLSERRELTVLSRPFLAALAKQGHHAELQAFLQPSGAKDYARLLANQQVIDVLRRYPTAWDAAALVSALRPLVPRMYSVASSEAQTEDEVHLTVVRVAFEREGEARWGVASQYLCDLPEGASMRVFIESNARFHLPTDGTRDIIMIGPGTGVAPFRAFVQQRAADGATGRNWLFFGDRHRHSDFLYQTEWLQALREGSLNRLDVAFSRDQPEKIYVQDRLREHGAEVWVSLEAGAYVYVCGDAQRMASDVNAALVDVISTHGGKSRSDATAWLEGLLTQGRYARDVY